MKRIGICTFYNNNNYGSYLQSFALLNKLKSLGNEVYLIDFKDYSKPWNRRLRNLTIINRLKCILTHPRLIFEALKARFVNKASISCTPSLTSKFHEFANKNLTFFPGNYMDGSFDAFITGSDQVWKITLPGLHYVFFLQFCPKEQRISYAASLGSDVIPTFNRKFLYRYLKSFKAISVREDSAVHLLGTLGLGISPVQVLDPVLLVGENFWLETIEIVPKSMGYIFLYFLDTIDNNIEILKKLIERYPQYKVLIVETGVKVEGIKGIEYIEPTPNEFVSLIRNSEVVITDSFHGTAFALLFSKEFYVLPRNYTIYPGQRDRLLSLLRMFNCTSRYITHAAKIDIVDSIDSSYIKSVLKEQQNISNDFLVSSIS